MVDGIIQKVLKRYVERLPFDVDYSIKDIQQELIADIEKEYAPNDKLYSSGAIRKQLIGDNKS